MGVLRQSGRQRFAKLHRDAAADLAKAAMAAGASTFVHVSALGASPASASLYARTKAEGELKVREAFPAATILRPSLLVGPEDNFFNRFAGLARMRPLVPFLPLVGGGKTKFQPVYVGDVADAIARAVSDPASARGRTYELAGPTVYSFRELMELMLHETCRSIPLVPVPFGLASLGASLLPFGPLTADQVRLLKSDSVMTKGALGLADLGIDADSIEAVIPSYLWRFRPQGQFQAVTQERTAKPLASS